MDFRQIKYCFFILLFLSVSCRTDDLISNSEDYYRTEMRQLVKNMAREARITDPDFLIVPQNGQDVIVYRNCMDCGKSPDEDYLSAIDATGREGLFYGYSQNNSETPAGIRNELLDQLRAYTTRDIPVLVTDYCSSTTNVNDSYTRNTALGFVSFASPYKELNAIPSIPQQPYAINTNNINSLNQVKNFLYLINPDQFSSKLAYLNALQNTDYDLLIIDAFYGGQLLSQNEVQSLGQKQNGSERLVMAYMSIGEAEDYRFYWQSNWDSSPPDFLAVENTTRPGNYKVNYWDSAWRDIIYSANDSYLNKLLQAGFDGAYLDMIDAFEYFED